MTRRAKILVLVGVAALVALVLVGASLLAARGGEAVVETSGPTVAGAGEVVAEFDGIPQEGAVLGSPDAPVTLVEYADFQCAFCAQWALGAGRELIEEYVKDGRLRIELRGLASIGPDSERALRAAYAAGEQNRLWELSELLYQQQGRENAGWVSEELLAAIAREIPGLDAARMFEEMSSDRVEELIAASARQAEADEIQGTPSFLIGPTGGTLERLEVTSVDPEPFREAIARLLTG